jgi:DNA-binding PadR family transcriptional regulator
MTDERISKELRKGSADLLILALVEDRPRHGYEIARLIGERSDGARRYHRRRSIRLCIASKIAA